MVRIIILLIACKRISLLYKIDIAFTKVSTKILKVKVITFIIVKFLFIKRIVIL